jgi:uncharacterized protein (DUF2141 family)
MKRNKLYFLLFSVICSLLAACASQSLIQGGPKDETPPALIQSKSSPNFQTNYKAKEIVFYFDEYVKVHEANSNVLVTPPLVYNPKVVSRGKKVVFQFNEKEELRENTTYIIQFGNGIQDITESNPAVDLFFVFSTGAQIDSFVIRGRMLHYEDFKPVDGALALLYDIASDSAIYNNRPVYFARTNPNGIFEIRYAAAGTYYLAGLKDENGNYRFDQSKEAVGFYDNPIELISDTLQLEPIFIFTESGTPIIQDVDSTAKGTLKVRFDKEITESQIEVKAENIRYEIRREPSGFTIFHEADTLIRHSIAVNHENGKTDSLKVVSYPLNEKMSNAAVSASAFGNFRRSEHPDSAITLQFTPPIKDLDPTKWQIINKSDSTKLPVKLRRKSADKWQSLLDLEPLFPGNFQIKIQEDGITDFYGAKNKAEIIIPLQIPEANQFVELALTLDSLDTAQAYIFSLMQKNKPIDRWQVVGEKSNFRIFKGLQSGEYTLEVLFDSNANGRRDSGKYLEKKYPERLKIIPLEALRPDWDSRQSIIIGGDLNFLTQTEEEIEEEKSAGEESDDKGKN